MKDFADAIGVPYDRKEHKKETEAAFISHGFCFVYVIVSEILQLYIEKVGCVFGVRPPVCRFSLMGLRPQLYKSLLNQVQLHSKSLLVTWDSHKNIFRHDRVLKKKMSLMLKTKNVSRY